MAKTIGEVLASFKDKPLPPHPPRQLGVREALIRKAKKAEPAVYLTRNPELKVKMEPGSLPEDQSTQTALIHSERPAALRVLFHLGARALRSKRRLNKAQADYDVYHDQLKELGQQTGFRGMLIRQLGAISVGPSVTFNAWDAEKLAAAAGPHAESIINPRSVNFEVTLTPGIGVSVDELIPETIEFLGHKLGASSIEEARQLVRVSKDFDVYEEHLADLVLKGQVQLEDDFAKPLTKWPVSVRPIEGHA